MQLTPRAVMFAAFGVGPLLLAAGCGGPSANGARVTLANIQPTSFVEIAPASTTTTTTISQEQIDESGISPVEQSYTIVAGDSISKIASLHGITNDQLISYNQWADGIEHLLIPGQTVLIPPDSKIPGTGTGTGTGTETDPTDEATAEDDGVEDLGEGCTHTIEAGEFPNKVARQYEITYEQLQAANPSMDMTTTFPVGAVLVIPPEGTC
jgi:LysM repeat protein